MTHCNYQRNCEYGLYRARNGMILGVCKGLSNATRIPLWLVRTLFVLFAIFTSGFPVVFIYLIMAIIMRPEPVVPFQSDEEVEFYNTHGDTRRSAIERMRAILSKLDRRVQRLENAVTDPEKDWERRFHNS